MQAHFHRLIGYFSAHPELALVAIFAAAMLEAVAVIGTVIPGSTLVFIGGALIGLGVLDPWWTAVAAIVGAIVGDGLSFWLGHRYGEGIRSKWPLRKHPELFERGRAYFDKRGRSSIFIGRFLGPLRAIVPLIAGMSGMPIVQFYIVNVISVLAWAAVHLLPGVAFGASIQLAGAVSTRLVVLLVMTAVFLWLLFKLWALVKRHGWHHLAALRDKVVARARDRPGVLSRVTLSFFDPSRPESSALLTAAALLIGGAWLFGGVVEDVLRRDPLVQFDQTVLDLFQGVRSGWADNIMVTITEAGGPVGTIALVVVITALLSALRYWRTLAYWLGTVGFAELLVWTLKFSLERKRPHNIYEGIEQYSLPSGHTTLSIVVYGFMAFLLARGKPAWQRTAIASSAAAVILAISASRIYLGVHWFSDVVASLSLGLAWLAIVSIAYLHHVSNERLRAVPVALLMVGAVVLVGGPYAAFHHEADLSRYSYEVAVPTTSLVAWRAGGWREQPSARSELGGDAEEPYTIQWAGTKSQLADVLAAEGWQPARGLHPASILSTLLPMATLEQLPVFPRFDHGRIQDLAFAKPLDEQRRLVVRLWRARIDILVAGNNRVPLWYGTATIERTEHVPHLGTLPRTIPDRVTPLRLLAQDARNQHVVTVEEHRDGAALMLLW